MGVAGLLSHLGGGVNPINLFERLAQRGQDGLKRSDDYL